MSIDSAAAQRLLDGVVVGSDGDELGKVGQLFTDNQTGEPTWVTVKSGLFGTHESFVPLDRASIEGDRITVPFDKETIKGAPSFASDEPLSEQDEDQLYSYYEHGDAGPAPQTVAVPDGPTAAESGYVAPPVSTGHESGGTDTALVEGEDTAAPAPATGSDQEITRSEEQLHVGTERVEAGRARLRKYVVTEQQTVTVPVSHEEVRIEREPIAEGDRAAYADAEIGEAEHEVVLTEERPVVQKDVVAVEKVRLGTQTVTEQQQVSADVRKEQVELAGEGNAAHVGDQQS